jgi:hypothetical protein
MSEAGFAPAKFCSATNTGAVALFDGSDITFNRDEASSGAQIDTDRATLTLNEAGNWKIAAGLSVASFTGAPTLTMSLNGAAAAFRMAIAAPGTAAFEWISNFPAMAKLKFTVTGGQVTLANDSNAYLTAIKLGA